MLFGMLFGCCHLSHSFANLFRSAPNLDTHACTTTSLFSFHISGSFLLFFLLFTSVLMLANHLNAGSRNANINGIRLSGLTKLSITKSSKNQTLLHFMIDKLFVKSPHIIAIEEDFPTLPEACVLSSTTMRSDRKVLELGLSKLIKTMEDADMNGDDMYIEKFADFKDKAEVLIEALCEKFDQAMALYGEACEYLAEDPKKMSHEDYFKLLKGFITKFKVERTKAENFRERAAAQKKKEDAKKKKAEMQAARGSARAPNTKSKAKPKETKSSAEIMRERRKRMSVTTNIPKKQRAVLTGTKKGGNSSSSSSGSDSSSSDSSSSDEE